MALSYTIDRARNLVTISGDYADAPEWWRVLDELLGDPRRRPGCLILRDQRGGTNPVDAATVVAIMAVVRSYWHKLEVVRAAIVMPAISDAPGVVAQALAQDDDLPIQAFVSATEALEWLLDDPAVSDARR